MGVKGLYTYLKHYRSPLLLEDVATVLRDSDGIRIGVDAMSILYRFKGDADEILKFLEPFRSAGARILFVFDGKPPPEKEREVQARKDTKTEAANQAASIESFLKSDGATALDERSRELLELSLQRCQAQSWHMTRDTRRAFQARLWDEGIAYVKSISEADDVLIDLARADKLDVILSTDMDYLLGGAKRLWIPVYRGAWMVEDLELSDILAGEGLTPAAFLDAGLLCGTEERAGARGVPCHTAFTWMRHYGSLETLLKSSVRDRAFREMFRDADDIAAARATRLPRPLWDRVRPDHFERTKDFLLTL